MLRSRDQICRYSTYQVYLFLCLWSGAPNSHLSLSWLELSIELRFWLSFVQHLWTCLSNEILLPWVCSTDTTLADVPMPLHINVSNICCFSLHSSCQFSALLCVQVPRSRTVSRSSGFFIRTVNQWNSLPYNCFPDRYDLSAFKRRVNDHLKSV